MTLVGDSDLIRRTGRKVGPLASDFATSRLRDFATFTARAPGVARETVILIKGLIEIGN